MLASLQTPVALGPTSPAYDNPFDSARRIRAPKPTTPSDLFNSRRRGRPARRSTASIAPLAPGSTRRARSESPLPLNLSGSHFAAEHPAQRRPSSANKVPPQRTRRHSFSIPQDLSDRGDNLLLPESLTAPQTLAALMAENSQQYWQDAFNAVLDPLAADLNQSAETDVLSALNFMNNISMQAAGLPTHDPSTGSTSSSMDGSVPHFPFPSHVHSNATSASSDEALSLLAFANNLPKGSLHAPHLMPLPTPMQSPGHALQSSSVLQPKQQSSPMFELNAFMAQAPHPLPAPHRSEDAHHRRSSSTTTVAVGSLDARASISPWLMSYAQDAPMREPMPAPARASTPLKYNRVSEPPPLNPMVAVVKPPLSPDPPGSAPAERIDYDTLPDRSIDKGDRLQLEIVARCSACRRAVALTYLFGRADAFARGSRVAVTCPSCAGVSAPAPAGKRRRGEPDGEGWIGCHLCEDRVGRGAISAGDGDPRAPDFQHETLCLRCNDAFRFCSKCGGGRQNRSGRWRPKEMFLANRKTCFLPHLRLGDASQRRTIVYRLPTDEAEAATGLRDPWIFSGSLTDPIPYTDTPAETVARDVAAFWRCAELNHRADGSSMFRRDGPSLTWDTLEASAQAAKAQIAAYVTGGFTAPPAARAGRSFRRYLALTFVPGPAGAIHLAGCALAQWNLLDRAVCFRSHAALGYGGMIPKGLSPALHASLVARLRRDAASAGLEEPLTAWELGLGHHRRARADFLLKSGASRVAAYAEGRGVPVESLVCMLVDYVYPAGFYTMDDVLVMDWTAVCAMVNTQRGLFFPPACHV